MLELISDRRDQTYYENEWVNEGRYYRGNTSIAFLPVSQIWMRGHPVIPMCQPVAPKGELWHAGTLGAEEGDKVAVFHLVPKENDLHKIGNLNKEEIEELPLKTDLFFNEKHRVLFSWEEGKLYVYTLELKR